MHLIIKEFSQTFRPKVLKKLYQDKPLLELFCKHVFHEECLLEEIKVKETIEKCSLCYDRRRRLKFRIMTLNFKSFLSPKFIDYPFDDVGDFSSNVDGLISI